MEVDYAPPPIRKHPPPGYDWRREFQRVLAQDVFCHEPLRQRLLTTVTDLQEFPQKLT